MISFNIGKKSLFARRSLCFLKRSPGTERILQNLQNPRRSEMEGIWRGKPKRTRFLLVLSLVLSVELSTSFATQTTRSSLYRITSNHVLLGKAMEIFYTSKEISCAQRCTSNSLCLSFNYIPSEGMCELNSGTENEQQTDLVYQPGYTFSKKLQ